MTTYLLAEEYVPFGVPFYRTKEIVELNNSKEISLELFISQERFELIKSRFGSPVKGDILISSVGTIGISWVVSDDRDFYFKDGNLLWLRNLEKVDPYFLKYCLDSIFAKGIEHLVFGAAYKALTIEKLKQFKIPLPPIAIQQEIVTEIEDYQKVINGARAVIDNYRPHIPINSDWAIVELCDVTESISDGDHMPPPKVESGIPFITISNINKMNQIDFTQTFFVSEQYYANLKIQRKPQKGDILYTVTGSYGIPVLIESDIRFCFQRHIGLIRPSSKINTRYLYYLLGSNFIIQQANDAATGVAQKTVSLSTLRNFSVPLPPLETQKAIVAEIEAEQTLVNANRELITRFEKKIQTTLNRIWGED